MIDESFFARGQGGVAGKGFRAAEFLVELDDQVEACRRVFASDRRWTVLTNAVPIAALLAPASHVELQLLPGRVRTTTQAAVGHATVEALGHFRADLAFVGTNGLTVAHGFSTPDPEEAATKRAMVGAAQRVVALADSSKIGQERTVRFARVDEVDVLVTDSRIDAADQQQLEAAGLEIARVG